MGFSDRLRAWMKGESSRSKRSPATDDASRSATRDLEEFAKSRIGVEAFLEPKTAIYSTTVLLVADDGEYLRRPVKDRDEAGAFARRINIPLYDARKVGYPKRMRDYDQGKRPRRVELSEMPPWPGEEPPGTAADGPPPPPMARRDQAPHARDDPAGREPGAATDRGVDAPANDTDQTADAPVEGTDRSAGATGGRAEASDATDPTADVEVDGDGPDEPPPARPTD